MTFILSFILITSLGVNVVLYLWNTVMAKELNEINSEIERLSEKYVGE